MSGKNQYPLTFNWQSTNPVPFLPVVYGAGSGGSIPSGVTTGTLSSTNTIYSQVIEVSRMDNIGLEVTFTGTPTGIFQVLVSNSGVNFYALTFDPILTQPSGSALGYGVQLTQLGFKYLMLEYTNSSGTGTLTVFGQCKDLN
jgi:hypothetical protein